MILKTKHPIVKFSVVSLLLISMTACQKTSFTAGSEDSPVQDTVDPQKVSCEIDPVDFNIKTTVYSFELTNRTKVKFGFNLLETFLKALGFKINLKQGTLNLAMKATDPMNESVLLAYESGQGLLKERDLGFEFSLGEIALGFDFYRKTPLANLSQAGLQDGFAKISAKLATLDWQNKVSKVPDENTVILAVGTAAGIRKGDQFNIYNVENIWQGAPCQSVLLISQKLSELPLAVGEAVQVDGNGTVLRIVSRSSAERIEPGALIEIKELKKSNPKESRALAKSVRIVSIDSPPLLIGDVKVNLQEYLKNQLGPVITEKGFYLYQ